MENEKKDQLEVVNQIYNFAANLMVKEKRSAMETKDILVKEGLDEASAATVVRNLELQIYDAKKERANKDMLYGALWCIGGIIATAANIGFIFWGAIVFGCIQFIKGVTNIPNAVTKEAFIESERDFYYCTHCDYTQEDDFEYCPKCLKNDEGLSST